MVYNAFFEAKKALFRKMNLWPEQSGITFRATSGISPIEGGEGFQLREEAADYRGLFEAENDDIGPKNTFFWDLNAE